MGKKESRAQKTAKTIIEDVMFESWSKHEEQRRQMKQQPFDQKDYTRF